MYSNRLSKRLIRLSNACQASLIEPFDSFEDVRVRTKRQGTLGTNLEYLCLRTIGKPQSCARSIPLKMREYARRQRRLLALLTSEEPCRQLVLEYCTNEEQPQGLPSWGAETRRVFFL